MKNLFIILFLAILSFGNTIEQIKDKNEIRIGINKSYPPFSTYEDGRFGGFEVEFAKEIAQRIFGNDISIVFSPLNVKEQIPMLMDNKLDLVVATLSVTNERKKLIDFSMPYFSEQLAIVAKKSEKIKRLSDFRYKRLLFVPGTAAEEYINSNPNEFSDIQTIECEDMQECFMKLKSGAADGYFHSSLSVAIVPIIDPQYKIAVNTVGSPNFIAVGLSKGNTKLLRAVDKAILSLSKEGFFKKAYDQTFNIYYKGTLDRKYFLLDDIYNVFTIN